MGRVNAKRIWLALGLAAFIGLVIVGSYVKRQPPSQPITCIDPVKGCVFNYHGRPAYLRFSNQPAAMQPFAIEVHAPEVSHVHVQAQMVGMDMGFNRYDLRPQHPDVFVARITLPVCVSGRREWLLYLEVGRDRYVLPFKSR